MGSNEGPNKGTTVYGVFLVAIPGSSEFRCFDNSQVGFTSFSTILGMFGAVKDDQEVFDKVWAHLSERKGDSAVDYLSKGFLMYLRNRRRYCRLEL